jgi:hypothetical protein
MGDYAGRDIKGGWEFHQDAMKESGERAIDEWSEAQGWGDIKKDRYGFVDRLSGISEYGFDPMSTESIAEALAKKDFVSQARESADAGPMEAMTYGGGKWNPTYGYFPTPGVNIWAHAEANEATKDVDRYKELDVTDVGEYWDAWREKEGNIDIYEDMAKGAGLTQNELGKLESTHSKWRRMENPLIQESTDQFRQNLDAIMSGQGGLRTGSAQQRRKELLQGYGSQLTDIRGKTQAARQKHAGTLASRIAKLFQE